MKKIEIKLKILELPRLIKCLIVITIDCFLTILAVWLAYYLRTGLFVPLMERFNEHYPLTACILAIIIFLPIFVIFKLYHEIFHFSGGKTLTKIIKAVALYAVIYVIIFTVIGVNGVPRTVGIIQPLIFMILIICSRFLALISFQNLNANQMKLNKKKRALIYGTDRYERELMIALSNNSEINIVGFLDDKTNLHNYKINGLNVYSPRDIKKIILQENIDEILLVLGKINSHRRNQIINLLSDENISIRTLPSYSDLIRGEISTNDINNLSIEDILGRDQVKPDRKLMRRNITSKVVLVTGAGGSIGSEICQQIYNQKPKKIILLDQNELGLYNILEKLKANTNFNKNHINVIPILGSVTDNTLLKNILKRTKPETIFHAAAYKHVPIVENNVIQSIKNNVFGTLTLAQLAIKAGVKNFILISSDKAVRPSSVMGQSKRLGELILQALSQEQVKTKFAIVRFGNVLHSSGSVVPLFKRQISSRGPVTITHIDMTRYFMTINEASELVIQAGAMIENQKKLGTTSPIYILDMGKPIKIYDLAKIMIKLSGLSIFNRVTQKGDVEIKFIGIRPGEKMHEELVIGNTLRDTAHIKIKYASEEFLPWPKLNSGLLKISQAIETYNQKLAMLHLKKLVSSSKTE
jgi:FlaA1/EpsC-like NDP-sugar epimerase